MKSNKARKLKSCLAIGLYVFWLSFTSWQVSDSTPDTTCSSQALNIHHCRCPILESTIREPCKSRFKAYLSHIGDHVECDVRESFMEVTANHADPGERVSCVGTCLIESHHMGQMGQLCVFLYQTHLREAKRGHERETKGSRLFWLHCFLPFMSHHRPALIPNKA